LRSFPSHPPLLHTAIYHISTIHLSTIYISKPVISGTVPKAGKYSHIVTLDAAARQLRFDASAMVLLTCCCKLLAEAALLSLVVCFAVVEGLLLS